MELRELKQLEPAEKLGSEANEGSLVNASTIDNVDQNDPRRAYYVPEGTIIFGKNKKVSSSADWTFNVQSLLDYLWTHKEIMLVKLLLSIQAERTHAGLHVESWIGQKAIKAGKPKAGRIHVNDSLVNRIDLMKPMFNGLDYGFNKLEPYDITSFFRTCIAENDSFVTIKLEADPNVKWDISKIILDRWVSVPLRI